MRIDRISELVPCFQSFASDLNRRTRPYNNFHLSYYKMYLLINNINFKKTIIDLFNV